MLVAFTSLSKTPEVLTVNFCSPTFFPSFHVTVALPSASVVACVGVTLPPSLAVNVTSAPLKATPYWSFTITTMGFVRSFPIATI